MTTEKEKTTRLIERAAKGDARAFADLFHQYFQQVYNYALSLCSDQALAEDLTQEAFIRAHDNLSGLGPPWKFKAWIFRLTRNLFIDATRRSRSEEPLENVERIVADETGLESGALTREKQMRVHKALAALPPQYREALALREFYEFPYAEIADIMGISLSNVKVLLHRGRDKFQEAYGMQLVIDEPFALCPAVSELLHALHDQEDVGDQHQQIREHLSVCEACQERQQRLHALSGLFALLPRAVPPAQIGREIFEKTGIDQRLRRVRITRLASLPLAAGILGALAVIAWMVYSGLTPPAAPQNAGNNQLSGPKPTATQTATQLPASLTASTLPEGLACTYTALINLFCRSGESYGDQLDSFVPGDSAEVIGQSTDGAHVYVIGPHNGHICAVPNGEPWGALSGDCSILPVFTPQPTSTSTPVPLNQPTGTATPTPTNTRIPPPS